MPATTVRQPHAKVPAAAPGISAAVEAGPEAPRPRGHYLDGGVSELLDLMRAVAAALVVLLHARLHAMGPGWAVRIRSGERTAFWVEMLTGWGHIAVVVFFVLSGYLIGGQVLNAPATDRRFWRSYGINRASRLLIVVVPAILFSVAVAYGSYALWGVSYNANRGGCLPTAQAVAANLLFLQKVATGTVCSNGPHWSIANEVFYYALFPFLLMAVRGATPRARMLAVVMAAVLVAYALHERFGDTGMLAYFGVWMLGAAAAYPFAPGRRGIGLSSAVLTLAVVSALSPLGPMLRTDYAVAAIVAGGLLIARRRGTPAWVRRPRVKQVAGHFAAFSFSLYLFHMPVMNLLRGALRIPPARGDLTVQTVSLFGALVVLAYALSYVAWLLFERHTYRLRSFLSRRLAGAPRPSRASIPLARVGQ